MTSRRPVVGIRELSRDTSKVIKSLEESGEPVIVTREGRPIAALVPVDQERLEDLVLAAAPHFAERRRSAEQAVAAGRTYSLDDVARAEGVEVDREATDADRLDAVVHLAETEFAPFHGLFSSDALSLVLTQAAEDAVEISCSALARVEGDEKPKPADVRRVAELNVGLFGDLFRHYLPMVLRASEPERALEQTVERATADVRKINVWLSALDMPAVRSYESALEGYRHTCRSVGTVSVDIDSVVSSK